MNISFGCVKCEADFELEVMDLMKDPTLVICPNCDAKADAGVVENAMSSLDEVFTQFARMQRRFRVGLSMEPDELTDELAERYDTDADDSLWSDEPDEEEEE